MVKLGYDLNNMKSMENLIQIQQHTKTYLESF